MTRFRSESNSDRNPFSNPTMYVPDSVAHAHVGLRLSVRVDNMSLLDRISIFFDSVKRRISSANDASPTTSSGVVYCSKPGLWHDIEGDEPIL